MNIVKSLIERIESDRQGAKAPCKSYLTEAAAEKATAAMAQKAANYFAKHHSGVQPCAHYVVFYVESLGRWVGCINLSELLRRESSTGGYLGFCRGFYTW